MKLRSYISALLVVGLCNVAALSSAQSLKSLKSIDNSDTMPVDLHMVRCAGLYAALKSLTENVEDLASVAGDFETEMGFNLGQAERLLLEHAALIAAKDRGWSDDQAANEAAGMKENFTQMYFDTLINDPEEFGLEAWPNQTWMSDILNCHPLLTWVHTLMGIPRK